ncbi:MAG: ADP-forming succinate--CoA ligase subunit beta [Rickettsiaceae bacterium]
MNIHEYQAKAILKKYGVNVSHGILIASESEIDSAIDGFDAPLYIVKAQIHAGGRGKGGGVKVCSDKSAAKQAARKMFGMNLITHQTGPDGQIVRRVYIESGCDIAKEYYFSCVLDRKNSCITFMVSTQGGVDIEEVAHESPEKIAKVHVNLSIGLHDFHCREIIISLGFKGEQAKQMKKIIRGVYNAFVATDAMQIEINPLVITPQGELKALDAKINFDDNSLFRHADIMEMRDKDEEEELEIRAADAGLSYVKMDGSIGCLVNGAGLAMATMDIIKLYGQEPANFLDVGGGATKEAVTEAFNIILSDKSVKAVLVNIFGGIMRCNIIADGIIAAAKEIGINVPIIVRLAGTNFELGKNILNNSNLQLIAVDDLGEAAKKVVESVK